MEHLIYHPYSLYYEIKPMVGGGVRIEQMYFKVGFNITIFKSVYTIDSLCRQFLKHTGFPNKSVVKVDKSEIIEVKRKIPAAELFRLSR